MIDAKQAQDRGLEVVNRHGIFRDAISKIVGLAEAKASALTPPPANQLVKQRGWWSRP